MSDTRLSIALVRFLQPALEPGLIKGLWLVNSASWGGSNPAYLNPDDLAYEHESWGTWEDRFGRTLDSGLFNYNYQSSGPVDSGTVTGTIELTPLHTEFRVFAQNGTWSSTRADIDMEFQRADGSVIAVMRIQRDANYRNGIWYGLSWSSLTKAPQTGSYPRTNGWLRFDPDGFEYAHDPNAYHSGINLDFRCDVDLSALARIHVPYMRAYMDYTGGSGSTTLSYLRAIGTWPHKPDIARGLVLHFTMDNISGSTLVDEAGNHNGTITGASQVEGAMGQGLQFNGGDNIVRVSDSSAFELNAFSVSFWMQSNTADNTVIIEKDGNAGWSVQTGQSFGGAGGLGINVGYGSGNGSLITSGVDFRDGAPHHVVFVVNGDWTGAIYLDGAEVSSYSKNDLRTPSYGSGTLDIGARYSQIGPYVGMLDALRIHNRALSVDEIALLYSEAGP